MPSGERMRRATWAAVPRAALARPALTVYCLAFVVRLVYNLTAAGPYQPTYDAALYDQIAHNLVNLRCYCLFGPHQTVSRAPLWPWIMSAIYSVAGQHDFYARLFYCALGAGTCVIVYRFARDLFGPRTGLLAGVAAGLYTGLFLYDGWLYTESLYTFCVTGVTYTLYRLHTAPRASRDDSTGDGTKSGASSVWRGVWRVLSRRRWALLCGLLIGAATLTRPNGVALLGVVILWAALAGWMRLRPWRELLVSTALVALVAVALVAPWTARNYAVAGAFIPVETGLGEVLAGSYNDTVAFGPLEARGVWRLPAGALNHDDPRYTLALDSQYTDQAIGWIVAHPLGDVYLWGLHLAMMWMPYNFGHGLAIEEFPNRLSATVVWVLIYLESIPMFLLAAAGLVTTWGRWKRALVPVYLLLITTALQNMLLYSTMRFRAPIEPLLVILAAAGIGALARWRARPVPAQEPVAAGSATEG